jgi:glycolate oxidase
LNIVAPNRFSKIALSKLSDALGGCVETDMNQLYPVSYDGLKVSGFPEALINTKKAEDVGIVLKLANEYNVPVTCRGAGSSLTGGATPIQGGWVLDLSRMNSISIDQTNMLARCGPGAVVGELQEQADKLGLFYPPDPSSKQFSTLGGNIACNAGGLRCVKYGVTRDYVLALSGYLPTGEFVRWGRATRKFATGYNLRDLWIGSEGTLGVVTEIILRLILAADSRVTFLAAFEDDKSALGAPLALTQMGIRPSIIEYMDRWTIDCLQQYVGKEVFTGIDPKPMLLIELDGTSEVLFKEQEILSSWLAKNSINFRTASEESEAEELWEVRRQGSSAMKKLASTKLNEDIVIPLDRQVELVNFVHELRVEFKLKIGIFGHCGDGNLHVNFMYDEDDQEETDRAVCALHRLMEKVVSLDGAISGEHGVGLAKSPFVRNQFNDAEWKTMKAIKDTLDPKGILNPGKIFDVFKPWEQKKENVVLSWELK